MQRGGRKVLNFLLGPQNVTTGRRMDLEVREQGKFPTARTGFSQFLRIFLCQRILSLFIDLVSPQSDRLLFRKKYESGIKLFEHNVHVQQL